MKSKKSFKRRIKVFASVVALAALLSCGCAQKDSEGEKIKASAQDTQEITISAESEVVERDNFKANVEIPEFDGFEEERVQEKINNRFRKEAYKFVQMHEQSTRNIVKADPEGDYSKTVSIGYEVKQNDGKIISVIVEKSAEDGGYGYSVRDIHNIDVDTGKEIELRKLFGDEDYRAKMESYVKKNIESNGQKYSVDISSDQDYYLEDWSIVLAFDPYALGSDQDKYFEIAVPFDEFETVNTDIDLKPYAVDVDYKNITVQEDWVDTDIELPVVSGVSNPEVEERINKLFESEIIGYKDEFEAMAKSDYESMKEYEPNPRPYALSISFEEKCNQDNILSLYVVYYQYTGGAHGMHTDIAYNIDLETGELINYEDLFNEDFNYKSVIESNIYSQIEDIQQQYINDALSRGESIEDAYVPYRGFEGISDDQPFYIEDDMIGVYFGLYEIAPYAAGIPTFEIPVSEFEGGFSPEYAGCLEH